MLLLSIRKDVWAFYAICDSNGSCQILSWLGQLNKKYFGSRRRMFAIIDKATESNAGPRFFPDDICHQVDQKNQIFEFIAGDLRLLWFYSPAERRAIICTHVFMKKSRKTPKKHIERAVHLKNLYIGDYKRGNIEIKEQDNNERI